MRFRAERLAGRMLIDMREAGERAAQGGDRKSKSSSVILIETVKLADLGITRNESSKELRDSQFLSQSLFPMEISY